jgi:argininosuccinate lyase
LKGIHLFDKAHVIMLIEQGIISEKDGISILREFSGIDKEGYISVRQKIGGGGHSGETYLIEKLGIEIGGLLHTGRSSADLIGVTIRVEERERILDILTEINLLCQVFLDTAGKHLESVMPAYTHFQQAQPLTFAHYLMSWVFSLIRDFDRFNETYKRVNKSPAGAAIVSGSPFPVNRERVAALLGFDAVIPNTRDAIFGYDPHLELFSIISILNNSLARFCSDLYIWSSTEYNLVELQDRFCGTSSINPSKKNPQALEQVFSLAADSTGKMITAFSVDRMPSESWEIQWRVWSQSMWPLLKKTIQSVKLINSVLSSLKIKKERMVELVGSGWAISSDLAAAIVKETNIPWRSAHQIVAHLVRICTEKSMLPRDITLDLIADMSKEHTGKRLLISQDALHKAVDPLECVRQRKLTGGPSPEQVIKQIDECKIIIENNRKTVEDLNKSLKNAENNLGIEIGKYIND